MLRYGVNDLRLFLIMTCVFSSSSSLRSRYSEIRRTVAARVGEPALTSEELCHQITMAGLEVDAIEPVAGRSVA